MTEHGVESPQLLFVPLGGAGEIGMNLNLYGYDGKWLMVDLGITFADERHPGIDIVVPDPAFIVERRDDLLGLVLTHAHEDHLGAVPYLWERLRCPVYATKFTAGMLKGKLTEAGLLHQVPLIEVAEGGRLSLGPFDVRYLPITHSIPESNALAIRTPAGLVLHTGDFKLDPEPLVGEPTERDHFVALGEEGVLAVIADSTNVFEPERAASEGSLRRSLTALVEGCEGRIAMTTFASHVARIETAAAVAAANGRHIALVGRSLWRTLAVARAAGYLNGAHTFLSEADAMHVPRGELLLLCAGSQGEPRGAMTRIARGEHPQVSLEPGDVAIFSSRIIPGNERALAEVHNRLVRDGVRVITEKDHFVHVSGHPGREDLAEMYRWLRPRMVVPVHGEARHLAEHAAFARSLQIPEAVEVDNGAVLRLAPGPAKVIDRAPAGRLLLDHGNLVAEDNEAVRQRRRLGQSGLLLATLVIDAEGCLAAEPQLMTKGVALNGGESAELGISLGAALRQAIATLSPAALKNDEAIKGAAAAALRATLKQAGAGRAAIETQIVRLGELPQVQAPSSTEMP